MSVAPVAPVPGLSESVTDVVWSFTAVFDAPARTATTGWLGNARAAVTEVLGWVVKTTRSRMSNLVLVVSVYGCGAPPPVVSVAVSRYPTPTVSIRQLENVATPLTVGVVLQPSNVPDPPWSGRTLVRAIVADAEVAVFPKSSWITTTGCADSAVDGVP